MQRPHTAGVTKKAVSPKLRQFIVQPRVSSEKLQQQSNQLGQTLSQLQFDQKYLLNQIKKVEVEKSQCKPQSDDSQHTQSWLGIKLKIQINQLNQQIEDKQEDIKELKKNPNYTKYQESKVLIEYLKYCSSNLKTEQQLMPNELEDLRIEIQELEVTKKMLEEQNENLSIQKSLLDKKISQQYLDLDGSKAELKDRERDLKFLKKEMKKMDEKQKELQSNQKVTVKKKEVIDLDDKKAEIIEKDQIIAQQESIINQLKEKLQERTTYELKSKNRLLDELQLMNNDLQVMKDELKELTDYYLSEIQPLETTSLPIIQGNKDHTFTILHDILGKQEKKYPKANRVKYEQVQSMGKEISLRLQLKMIEINDAVQQLVGGYATVITVQQLQEQLLQEPFTVADPSDAKILARYMIEDANDEVVTLDPENNSKISIVKSVFRHLLGCYTLLTSEQDKQYWDEISQIVVKFDSSLKSQFELLVKQQAFMTPHDLFYCLDQLFMELSDQQKEYVLLRLFAYTNNINKIMHMKIFDVFRAGSYIDRVQKDSRKKKPRRTIKKIELQKDDDLD